MQPGNRCLGCAVIRHLDKAKAARASCVPVSNQVDTIHHTIRREQLTQILFSHREGHISHKNIHGTFLLHSGLPKRPIITPEVTPRPRSEEHTSELQSL